VNGRAVDGGSVAAAVLRDAVDDELWAHEPVTAAAGPRPCRAIGAGPSIAGTPFKPAQLARATAAAARQARGRR